VRVDPWFWLRDREDVDTLEYLRAENAFAEAAMKPTKNLQEALLEANHLATGQTFLRIGVFKNSPDHRWLAYSVNTDGSETYTIHVVNLLTGYDYIKSYYPTITSRPRITPTCLSPAA